MILGCWLGFKEIFWIPVNLVWKIACCNSSSPRLKVYNTFLLKEIYLFRLKFQYFYLSDKKDFSAWAGGLRDRIDAITTSFIWDITDILISGSTLWESSLKKRIKFTRTGLRSLVTLSSKQICACIHPPYKQIKVQFFTVRQVWGSPTKLWFFSPDTSKPAFTQYKIPSKMISLFFRCYWFPDALSTIFVPCLLEHYLIFKDICFWD